MQVSNFDNELSKTALKLDLYAKEGLFYEHIWPRMRSIHAPRTHGVVRRDGKIGILMEDMRTLPGAFNLDLNADEGALLRVVPQTPRAQNFGGYAFLSLLFNEMDERLASHRRSCEFYFNFARFHRNSGSL